MIAPRCPAPPTRLLNWRVALLIFGIGSVISVILSAKYIGAFLRPLIVVSLTVGGIAMAMLLAFKGTIGISHVAFFLWGLAFGPLVTMYQAAVSKQVENAKDVATSVQSSVFNFSIMIATWVGGMLRNALVMTEDIGARTAASHTCSFGSADNAYAFRMMNLFKKSGMNFISLPTENAYLQGRQDTYPKRRGLTRVKELWESGINVCFGQDSINDPSYPIGNGNLMNILDNGIHLAQTMSFDELDRCLDLITCNGAKTLNPDTGAPRSSPSHAKPCSKRPARRPARPPHGSPMQPSTRRSPARRRCRATAR